ncbi:MAG: HAD-IIB family hydrolase [Nanoarchaeota archaeon]
MMQQIIFTDLDGTLLDGSYSYNKAKDALAMIKKKKIPLVFCTSKSKAETEFWQKRLKIKGPFVIENGGAIIIPKGYFNNKDKKTIVLGSKRIFLRQILKKIEKETGSKLEYLTEMSDKRLKEYAKLPRAQIKLAKKRHYIESFRIIQGNIGHIIKLIKKHKKRYTHAKLFHHMMGDNDKGKAVKLLTEMFKKKYGKISTIGLGDSINDKEMLKNVDKGYLLKDGPQEWNNIILGLSG